MKQLKNGVQIAIKVIPKSSMSCVIGIEENYLKVKVTSPPDKGKANKEVLEVLSDFFDFPLSRVFLLKGETSRLKLVLIEDASLVDLQRKLSSILEK